MKDTINMLTDIKQQVVSQSHQIQNIIDKLNIDKLNQTHQHIHNERESTVNSPNKFLVDNKNKAYIFDDKGELQIRNITPGLKSYDGFVNAISHTDYRHIIDNKVNLYRPVSHLVSKPYQQDFISAPEKYIPHSIAMLKQIFVDTYRQGLAYMKKCWLYPHKSAPILMIIGSGCGSSTFLRWMNLIYENNMAYLSSISKSHFLPVNKGYWAFDFADHSELNHIDKISKLNKFRYEKKFMPSYEIDIAINICITLPELPEYNFTSRAFVVHPERITKKYIR